LLSVCLLVYVIVHLGAHNSSKLRFSLVLPRQSEQFSHWFSTSRISVLDKDQCFQRQIS